MCRHKQHIHALPRQLAVLRHLRRKREGEEGEVHEELDVATPEAEALRRGVVEGGTFACTACRCTANDHLSAD